MLSLNLVLGGGRESSLTGGYFVFFVEGREEFLQGGGSFGPAGFPVMGFRPQGDQISWVFQGDSGLALQVDVILSLGGGCS